MPNYVQGPPFPRGLTRGIPSYSFGALTAVAIAASPGGLSRAASGTVTVTTSVAHKFLVGEIATIVGSTSVNGTRFDGNYFVKAAPAGTTLTLIPIDDVLLHQAADTGGVGTVSCIQMEQPAPPQAGLAFGVPPRMDGNVSQLVIDGKFDGAPGAFEVDIQAAPVDVDAMYQIVGGGNLTAVDGTNFTFHVVMTDWDNFVRLRLLSRANGVNFAGAFRLC